MLTTSAFALLLISSSGFTPFTITYCRLEFFNSLFDDGGEPVIHNGINTVEEYVKRIFYMDGIFYLETGNYAFPAYSIGIPASPGLPGQMTNIGFFLPS